MSLITVKHTYLAYKMILKELSILKKVLNYIIQTFFFGYYVYLIVTHLDSPVRLALYSVLLVVLIVSFIIDLCVRDKENDTRKAKKTRKENKKKIRFGMSIVKYLVKVATIVLTIIDLIVYGVSDLALILLAVSIVMLIASVASDVAIYLVEKYASMMYLAVKLDIESSEAIKMVSDIVKETKGQESISDEEYYTDAELKTIEYLKEEAGDNLEPVKENNKKDSFGKKIFKSIAKKAISKTINKE
ncbi:MAG: hypothetical protein MJ248_06960 [Bacilli bacterium]|nr:hypothetical protein [Bacilli bacterium]